MSKKVKMALAVGLQLGLIASIGDFVGWSHMKYVLIAAVVSFFIAIILFIYDMSKD